MIGAQALVEILVQYDVNVIFGVPGDTNIALYEALYDAGSTIRHVMARDERSASFMADAYARISHKPGVCECPSGAGPLYSIPGVAEANASSIPLILLTSDIPLAGEGKKTITELDCQKLFEPITKWSNLVKDVERVPEIIRRAFRVATTGRPGAVHLAFPEEVLTGEFQGGKVEIYAEPECRQYPAYRTRGSRKALEEVVEHIKGADRPVLIAGGGAKYSQASRAVISLVERISAPVVTTISGQGIIPDEHTLAMGVIGDNGFHPHAHQALEEGDVLIYIGCKMGSVSTIKWTLPSYDAQRKIIQIDLDPELLSNNVRNTQSIAGDAKLVLEDLVTLLEMEEIQREPSKWVRDLNRSRKEFWKHHVEKLSSESVPIKPQRVVAALNKRIQPPTIVIADAGTPTPYISRFLKLGGGSTFIIPRAYGGLGYAIPALVGAHFANPNAKLVGLFGDGSLGMSAGDLETLARLKIPAVLILFNNACFGWIKALQALHSKKKFFSVDFLPGDPVLIAKGFGIKAFKARTSDELEGAIGKAFSDKGPVLVDVLTESEATELPPVYSWWKAAEKHNIPILHT